MVKLIDDLFGETSEELAETLRGLTGSDAPRVALIADINVVQQNEGLGSKIGRYFNLHGIELCSRPLVLAGGEKVKSDRLASAIKCADALLDAKLGTKDLVLVLGGGSILDVAGYAAAQVRGGVGLVRVPTTVAAMIDGAFAGYAAVNSPNVKDALRVKCDPAAVMIDRTFAKTVLDGVWRAGFSEAARLAVAGSAGLMKELVDGADYIRNRDFGLMCEVVEKCIELRARTSVDAFGEWAALRLEAMSGYKLPHGYAMAIGMMIDANYARLKGIFGEEEHAMLETFLQKCGAFDGANHSRYLLGQIDTLLFGIDAWQLAHGGEGIRIPNGLGNLVQEKNPDRETMRNAVNMIKYQ